MMMKDVQNNNNININNKSLCLAVGNENLKQAAVIVTEQTPRNNNNSNHSNSNNSDTDPVQKIAVSETRLLLWLRLALFVMLVSVTVLVSYAVYTISAADEHARFVRHAAVYHEKILDSVRAAVSTRFEAMQALSIAVTSQKLAQTTTVTATDDEAQPFVTLPHFEMRGSALRVTAASHALHYMPLIVDEAMRAAWETYAAQHRQQIDAAFVADATQRQRQDVALGYTSRTSTTSTATTNDKDDNKRRQRHLRQDDGTTRHLQPQQSSTVNETILDDGTGYHPRIWSNGAFTPRGDEAEGEGPYLPLWQRR